MTPIFSCAPIVSTSLMLLAFGVCAVNGQSPGNVSWQADAEARLKAIYEQGEFRSRRLQTEWLEDSSGYTILDPGAESEATIRRSYDVRTGKPLDSMPASEEERGRRGLVSPDGKQALEFEGRDLFVRDIPGGKRTKLPLQTEEGDIRFQKPAWSPDGKRILFVESNATRVRQRAVLVPEDPSYPGVEYHRFARVGEVIDRLRVGVIDSDGTNLRWLALESPPEGFYLGQVDWAGNAEEILVEKFSRFRNRREFLLAKSSGEVNRIYDESNDAWVESSQGRNSGLAWVQDGKAFIVVSEKDGWRHAFLYSREGEELAVLTPGEYDIIERAIIDEAGGWYYFYASPDDGTRKYLYRVPLDGSGTLARITPEDQPGTHDYDFSPDAKWAIHTHSALDSPPRTEIVELAGHRVAHVIEDNSELHEKLKRVLSRPTEFLELDLGNGLSMDAWMIKPGDFDPSRKYPVFVYVYGEPHAQTVLDEWGAVHIDFHRLVADLGYLVVSIDNRGTPAPKGAAWRRSVFGSLGPLSTEEQEAGLKELARTRPYVDLSRVGIWGWSGGGSNTLNAMFRKPDTYHVGIAVVPKPQAHLYNAWFQEMFMQTREVNSDGYERASAINFADGLKGKLLIITGSGETNTHIQIIEGLVDRLVELGKSFDYMVYPNRDHGLREGPGTSVHVRMLIIRYLMENLPPGPR